ncbi:retrotransposon protein, putative, ty1-copia subclass [Tanacetum coccineum]|uniref:Retrotransposon protein, putative, ty1-copia subclass n=1 Tax=Tanacetum coccineum TaxID=301880 RepID=A0ABQ5HBK9_9ASTR
MRVVGTYDYLYNPFLDEPPEDAAEDIKAAWKAEYKIHYDVACLMLGKMSPALQRQFELYILQAMLNELIKCLKSLKLSLNKDFGDFVRNFNMHCMGKTVSDLHALLIDYEKGLKDKAPTPQVLAIQQGRVNKPKPQANKKGKGKGKVDKNKQVVAYQPKPKQNPPQKKVNPKKDQACHHYHVVGHWKRNCPLYLQELRTNKNKKAEHGAAASGNLFTIKLFNLTHKINSWVYDTGCGIHVCNTLQGFRVKRKLSYGEQYLHVGNRSQAVVEAIGVFNLVLPSGLELLLNNCHYAPSIIRGVVSFSCLLDLRFVHTVTSNGISVSLNGLLEKINDESYDKCKSCISGKMTKKPFNDNIERAIDLLGLIRTDVCGPFRHVSRKGNSYFLTFTDDFSRYGYVYLLKHKHEVFETFKVFKSEVELQLGKKIKALLSDRGGEYLSQEFKEYLDMVRSMFNLTTQPLSFWDYALESAVRILNMVLTKKVDNTPYEIWYGKVPNLSYLKVWGCEAYVKHKSADKLQQRSVKCIFVGYPKETMGYYFYFLLENKVIVARSKRTKYAPNRLNLNIEVKDDVVRDLGEPANYKADMLDPDKSKWLFKKKTDMDGKVHTYKARLVAKGCTQTYEIDYEETFSPIADIRAIRILIAIAAYYDYEI